MLNFDGVKDALAVFERARTEFEKLGYTVNIHKQLTLSEWNHPSVNDQVIEFELSAKRLPLLDALSTQKTEDAVG
jgi:hypothetical protein